MAPSPAPSPAPAPALAPSPAPTPTQEPGFAPPTPLADPAIVVRGGNEANHSPDRIDGSIGPSRIPGVIGFSAQCNGGTNIAELAQCLRNRQIGITTVGAIRAADGDVVATPGLGYHVTVTGLSGAVASPIFYIIRNPNSFGE